MRGHVRDLVCGQGAHQLDSEIMKAAKRAVPTLRRFIRAHLRAALYTLCLNDQLNLYATANEFPDRSQQLENEARNEAMYLVNRSRGNWIVGEAKIRIVPWLNWRRQ